MQDIKLTSKSHCNLLHIAGGKRKSVETFRSKRTFSKNILTSLGTSPTIGSSKSGENTNVPSICDVFFFFLSLELVMIHDQWLQRMWTSRQWSTGRACWEFGEGRGRARKVCTVTLAEWEQPSLPHCG
uniref:Uncharacterized protein n=1 Tax=Physcomitrium patens TaxID=3218 RepID=A0A2K1KEI9_PHYPA|nr:hypothetical protein PHYPA_008564 [Physcomitrium patens]